MSPDQLIEELPPASDNEINLAIASLVIYSSLMPLLLWITWCHGKLGVVCWGLVVSQFGIHIAGDAYKIARRNQSDVPDAFSIMASAGVVTCSSLSLLGVVFEANVITPQKHSKWVERSILGAMHVLTTGGIAMATYGGSPDSTSPTGVRSSVLSQTGNLLMIAVLAFLTAWLLFTVKKIISTPKCVNYRAAKVLCIAAGLAIPCQVVRLVYATTFAFVKISILDPFFGSFAVELVLLFGTQLLVSMALIGGGWRSRNIVPLGAQTTPEIALQDVSLPIQTDRK